MDILTIKKTSLLIAYIALLQFTASNSHASLACQSYFAPKDNHTSSHPSNSTASLTPLKEKREIQRLLIDLKERTQPYLDFKKSVSTLKTEITEAHQQINILSKEITYLLKKTDFSSTNYGIHLKATEKHKLLIEEIKRKLTSLDELKNKLEALQRFSAQVETYITNQLLKDQEELNLLRLRLRDNLNISEVSTKNMVIDAVEYSNQLRSVIEALHDFNDLSLKINMLLNAISIDVQINLTSKFREPLRSAELQINLTSGDFKRIPEIGELVVIEDGTFIKTYSIAKVDTWKSNISNKKFALITTDSTLDGQFLSLDGVKHGDIYANGSSTYAVIGFFADGRIMLQRLEAKNQFRHMLEPPYTTATLDVLKRKYKLIKHDSFNRPTVIGDRFFQRVGDLSHENKKAYGFDNPYLMKQRENDFILVQNDGTNSTKDLPIRDWDPKDTDGVRFGSEFVVPMESLRTNYYDLIKHGGVQQSQLGETATFSVKGVYSNGDFFVNIIFQTYSENSYSYSERSIYTRITLEALTEYYRKDWDAELTPSIALGTTLSRESRYDMSSYYIHAPIVDTKTVEVLGYVNGKLLVSKTHSIAKKSKGHINENILRRIFNRKPPIIIIDRTNMNAYKYMYKTTELLTMTYEEFVENYLQQ